MKKNKTMETTLALGMTVLLLVGCGTDREVSSIVPPAKGENSTNATNSTNTNSVSTTNTTNSTTNTNSTNNANNTNNSNNSVLPDKCEPLDAELSAGANPCDAAQWIFDGTGCVYKGGLCECTGADCDKLQVFGSEEDCRSAFVECLAPASCAAMNIVLMDPICDSGAWIWNGVGCVQRNLCGCEGPDCDMITQTKQDCEVLFAQCLPASPLPACAAQDVTLSEPMCDNALWIWDGTSCVDRSGHCSCDGADCDKLFSNEQDCKAAYSQCIDPCAPMDFTPVDPFCDGPILWYWNGVDCVGNGGACGCEGKDCGEPFGAKQDCLDAYQKCVAPATQSCDPMDAAGYNADPNNPCDTFLGYKWNGSKCEYIGGYCSCVGADCDELYQDKLDCVVAHAGC